MMNMLRMKNTNIYILALDKSIPRKNALLKKLYMSCHDAFDSGSVSNYFKALDQLII